MASFKDGQKRDWVIALDGPKIHRIRQELKVDIADTTGTAYAQLRSDVCLLVNVLYLLCQRQCEERKLTDEDFGQLLYGEGLKKAREALVEAIRDFIPDQEETSYLLESIGALEAERRAKMAPALARITDPKLMERISEAAGAAMDQLINETLSSNATASPDSAESAPTT